jgi:hypothetical protein
MSDRVLTRELRPDERLVQRNRRLRRLLVDVLWYLEHPSAGTTDPRGDD